MAITTKLIKLSPATIEALHETGLAIETTNTYAVLEGDPATAHAAVVDATAKAETDGASAKLVRGLGTAAKKLAANDPAYVCVLGITAELDPDDSATYGEDLGDLADLAERQRADDEAETAAPATAEEPSNGACHCGDDPVGHVHGKATKKGKAKAEPKRAELPEGYTTPVGLAKEINARGLYNGKREDGLSSQSMYTYVKNAGPDSAHPFPSETVNGRFCVNVEAGVRWWIEKEERVAARSAKPQATTGQEG